MAIKSIALEQANRTKRGVLLHERGNAVVRENKIVEERVVKLVISQTQRDHQLHLVEFCNAGDTVKVVLPKE